MSTKKIILRSDLDRVLTSNEVDENFKLVSGLDTVLFYETDVPFNEDCLIELFDFDIAFPSFDLDYKLVQDGSTVADKNVTFLYDSKSGISTSDGSVLPFTFTVSPAGEQTPSYFCINFASADLVSYASFIFKTPYIDDFELSPDTSLQIVTTPSEG